MWESSWATAHCARLSDTKSGAQNRPLGRATLHSLESFKPKGVKPTDFIFPGNSKAGHFIGLPKVWERVAARGGIEGVSLHGLRHWFGNAATELGYSELIIGALLGHAARGVTGRYASAPDPALVAAADRVSQRIMNALDGKEATAKVVRIGAA